MIYPNTVLFSAYDFARQLPDQYRNSAHSTLTVMTKGVGLKGPFMGGEEHKSERKSGKANDLHSNPPLSCEMLN